MDHDTADLSNDGENFSFAKNI